MAATRGHNSTKKTPPKIVKKERKIGRERATLWAVQERGVWGGGSRGGADKNNTNTENKQNKQKKHKKQTEQKTQRKEKVCTFEKVKIEFRRTSTGLSRLGPNSGGPESVAAQAGRA